MNQQEALRLIYTYQRVGLLPALIEVAALLDEHGQEKHGDQGWKALGVTDLHIKATRHLGSSFCKDHQSGRFHAVHAAARCLQMIVVALEDERAAVETTIANLESQLRAAKTRLAKHDDLARFLACEPDKKDARIAELERELEIAKAAAGPRGVPPMPTEEEGM